MNRISANLDIKNISGSQKGLVALLAAKSLPGNIALPGHFSLKGKLNGGVQDLITDLVLNTSSGTVTAKGYIRQFRDPAKANYDLTLQTSALDLGYILKDTLDWGTVTANFTAKGHGLDLPHANATLNGHIASAVIRKYDYRDFQFDGSIADRQFQIQSSIDNEAIHFDLQVSGELQHKFPALKLDWQIDTLDLKAVHRASDTLQFRGRLSGDFASTNPDSLEGQLKLANLVMVQGGKKLATDSILLLARRIDDKEDIQLHSEMADLDWNGEYKLTELPQALEQTLNKYYRINGFKDTTFTAQDWQMQIRFRASPLVLAYIPSLKGMDSMAAQIVFNSDRNDLRMALNAPKVQFGSQVFQKVSFQTSTGAFAPIIIGSAAAPTDSSAGRQLKYRLDIAGGSGSGFVLHQTSLRGYLADNKLLAALLLKDSKGKDRYRLAGQLDKMRDGLKFILNPDSLLLNYDPWQVSRDNFLLYDSAGIVVNDFSSSNKAESLQINSNPPAPTSPIDVDFTNLQLNTLSRFAAQDSLNVNR